jgi:hypothetical protein
MNLTALGTIFVPTKIVEARAFVDKGAVFLLNNYSDMTSKTAAENHIY